MQEKASSGFLSDKSCESTDITNQFIIYFRDSRSPRDGRFIEEIGTYDPNTDPSTFKVNEELAKKWLNNGAQPTEIVGKIFKAAGIEK